MKKFSILAAAFCVCFMSHAETFKQTLKMAKTGDPAAQALLGMRYFHGDGLRQDYYAAVKWLRMAADSVPRPILNPSKRKIRFRKSAVRQNADAQFLLGYCYQNGYGVGKDFLEAAKWFRKSAEQGNADAQFSLGRCYSLGEGVEKNPEEALIWYKKSAEQGQAHAQCSLGFSYAVGDGVEHDSLEAAKWFRKSAEQGHIYAQRFLGLCYAMGDGVEYNLPEAKKWLGKAAEQGDEEAAQALEYLAKKERAERAENGL